MSASDYCLGLFPLKISSVLLWRPWETAEVLKRFEGASFGFLDPLGLVKRAIPESVPIKVTEIIPRLREGGAYVKFTYPANTSAAEIEGIQQPSPHSPLDEMTLTVVQMS
jgi:hypothetical protein